MLSETKVSSKYQTVVPSKVRNDFDIEPGDILEWEEKGDHIIIKVRKRVTLNDITGIISVGGDAVGAKKRIQRGSS
ncbi:MAG: AbrB/MazE/SpoVT family DNA-binding domain-containing protein [Thermoplasmata archaeon]|nr:MAG: AbrB/MazE/SpoVT family DNA-binding domain-containing protein [Thermoplasmata archaeon]